jgi:hypothetical protein
MDSLLTELKPKEAYVNKVCLRWLFKQENGVVRVYNCLNPSSLGDFSQFNELNLRIHREEGNVMISKKKIHKIKTFKGISPQQKRILLAQVRMKQKSQQNIFAKNKIEIPSLIELEKASKFQEIELNPLIHKKNFQSTSLVFSSKFNVLNFDDENEKSVENTKDVSNQQIPLEKVETSNVENEESLIPSQELNEDQLDENNSHKKSLTNGTSFIDLENNQFFEKDQSQGNFERFEEDNDKNTKIGAFDEDEFLSNMSDNQKEEISEKANKPIQFQQQNSSTQNTNNNSQPQKESASISENDSQFSVISHPFLFRPNHPFKETYLSSLVEGERIHGQTIYYVASELLKKFDFNNEWAFFDPILTDEKNVENQDGIKMVIKKEATKKIAFFYFENGHFTIAIFDKNSNSLYYFDPLFSEKDTTAKKKFDQVQKHLNFLGLDPISITFSQGTQEDDTNCGLFVLSYFERFLKEEDIPVKGGTFKTALFSSKCPPIVLQQLREDYKDLVHKFFHNEKSCPICLSSQSKKKGKRRLETEENQINKQNKRRKPELKTKQITTSSQKVTKQRKRKYNTDTESDSETNKRRKIPPQKAHKNKGNCTTSTKETSTLSLKS